MGVGAEAICPSIWQIASLHCVPFAMTVTMGRLLPRKNGAGCAS